MTNSKPAFMQNEYMYLEEVRSILLNVLAREHKRHEMDTHLTPSMLSLIENEILPMLENELDYDPSFAEEEPSITMSEMHTAAWKQHQEMHS